MKTRKMSLSGSWYPGSGEEVKTMLQSWTKDVKKDGKHYSAVVPHAGWYFSGELAARTLCRLCPGRELVIVIGGHLPPGSPVLASHEDYLQTPDKDVVNRLDILGELEKNLKIKDDIYADNTVEIVLSMAAVLSPESDFLWLRAPADQQAVDLGEELHRIVSARGLDAVVVGSTDLTHYGSNYGYAPAGSGEDGLRWVREVNDAGIIELMREMKPEAMLEHANGSRSACSPGAAAAAVRYASLNGVSEGEIAGYHTSHDVHPAESFVGYAGMLF